VERGGNALELRALSAEDREAASSAGTLIRAADSILNDTLGLDLEHDVPSLAAYLESKRHAPATTASAANGADPDPQSRPRRSPHITPNRPNPARQVDAGLAE